MNPLRRLRRQGPVDVFAPRGFAELSRDGPAPLAGGAPANPKSLRVAFVVPSFRRVSGGHTTIAGLVRALERRGHSCSLWISDDQAESSTRRRARLAADLEAWFGGIAGETHGSLEDWAGADVVVATAWQTVPAVLGLRDARARAYFVQDHEPEFYGASAERLWATATYTAPLHCIALSPWLVAVLRERYGTDASLVGFALDHDVYRLQDVPRRDDLVVFYARPVTARRGVGLGLLALEELKRRRPHVEVALFGEDRAIRTAFAHTQVGVLERPELARLYASAAAGMVLSLTNPSLIGNEMLACGLPCVDVAGDQTRMTYGTDLPVTLAEPDPLALCAALEATLDDPAPAQRLAAATAGLTWERTAAQFEAGLHAALAA